MTPKRNGRRNGAAWMQFVDSTLVRCYHSFAQHGRIPRKPDCIEGRCQRHWRKSDYCWRFQQQTNSRVVEWEGTIADKALISERVAEDRELECSRNIHGNLRWVDVIHALERNFKVPDYLMRMIRNYLKDRVLIYNTTEGKREMEVTSGSRTGPPYSDPTL
ncbi:hypothetical protein EVAR_69847_1 [Eumeta japonica]|uniref:Uncharacterized protein n=1 Tax=Eumeta variegata TaxID=151549 RepID=A0A4C2AE50_EUMVA|nr:hypothetical protein EVAR_69847_1 [Eumeta japonica]